MYGKDSLGLNKVGITLISHAMLRKTESDKLEEVIMVLSKYEEARWIREEERPFQGVTRLRATIVTRKVP